jgi:hypothetical protein
MPEKLEVDLFREIGLDKKFLSKFISPITDDDEKLIKSFLKPPEPQTSSDSHMNFEDSFEYIRMYFNSGRYSGFKYYDDESLLVFALEKKKKPHFKLFKPLGENANQKLSDIIAGLSAATQYPIQMVCLNNGNLKALRKVRQIEVKNIKEFSYYIYDLERLDNLKGRHWKNVRQKIATFNRNYPKLKAERLSMGNSDDTVHFIGAWRRYLLSKRQFSYVNLEKNKFAAKYYADKNDYHNIWASVYKLRGRIVAFQLLYRLGTEAAAHAIGLADTEIKGLSEFSQMHIWNELASAGIRYINDGPSWRSGLDRYKRKFNPIATQQVFECKVKSS